jgi:hypothetical protein
VAARRNDRPTAFESSFGLMRRGVFVMALHGVARLVEQ